MRSVGTRLCIVVANRHVVTAGRTHQTITRPLNGFGNVADAMNASDADVVI